MSFRPRRLAEEIKREVTSMLQAELKDPRICRLSSITDVEVSRDLRYAKLFVSVYGSEEEQSQTLTGLQSAGGFIRSELGKRIRLRFLPELTFCLDQSIGRGVRLANLIRRVTDDTKKEQGARSQEPQSSNES
jgi:ribosome-binding factor A